MVALCVEKRGRPTALRLSRAADCCVEARFCAASKQDKQRSKKAELEISYLQRRIVGLGMCRCRDTAKGLWRYGFIYFIEAVRVPRSFGRRRSFVVVRKSSPATPPFTFVKSRKVLLYCVHVRYTVYCCVLTRSIN